MNWSTSIIENLELKSAIAIPLIKKPLDPYLEPRPKKTTNLYIQGKEERKNQKEHTIFTKLCSFHHQHYSIILNFCLVFKNRITCGSDNYHHQPLKKQSCEWFLHIPVLYFTFFSSSSAYVKKVKKIEKKSI